MTAAEDRGVDGGSRGDPLESAAVELGGGGGAAGGDDLVATAANRRTDSRGAGIEVLDAAAAGDIGIVDLSVGRSTSSR